MFKHKKNIKIAGWVLLILVVLLVQQIFWPRHYNVPEREAKINTTFWHLSTGSTIGYTYIASTLTQKQIYPIIYLHGGPGGAISQNVIDDLKPLSAEGFDLYLYDQVGSGASGRLTDISQYTVERHVKDLNEIIDKINSAKVILIGQSWGAILAAAYISKHPGKVNKVIFTSPGPIYPINKTQINTNAPDSLHLRSPQVSNKVASSSSNNIRMKTITFFATKFNKKIATDKEVDKYATYLNSQTNKSALCDTSIHLTTHGGSGYYSTIMTYNNLLQIEDFRAKIKNVNIPALILKGQCDNQPWGATSEYLKLFPNHKFTLVPNAGHFISIEQPKLYLREIKIFLLK